MEFKLSERKSHELLNHFGNYASIIEKIHSEAYDILERYYEQYASVPKNYWFKPMSFSRFLTKICKGSGYICVSLNSGWQKSVYTYNHAELDVQYMRKFGIVVEPIAHTVIDAAIEAPTYFSKKVEDVNNIYELLMEYSTPPFIVDEKMLDLFHKIRESNNEHIAILATLGIKYEL